VDGGSGVEESGQASTADQVARVETLLDALRDMVSSLASMNRQLGREVTAFLNQHAEVAQPAADVVELLSRENAQLKEALEGRGLIERAKGMLMVARRCDEDAAFQLLVAISRRERRRVRDVAADLVAAASRGEGTDTGATSVPGPRRDQGQNGRPAGVVEPDGSRRG